MEGMSLSTPRSAGNGGRLLRLLQNGFTAASSAGVCVCQRAYSSSGLAIEILQTVECAHVLSFPFIAMANG